MPDKISRFDQVRLLTTRNVSYLSAPPGMHLDPKGIWSVIGAVGNDLLLAKKQTIIRIPSEDVKVLADFDVNKITASLENLIHGRKERNAAQDPGRTAESDQ